MSLRSPTWRDSARALARNLAWGTALTAVACLCFQVVARHIDPTTAARLATPADDAIPFEAWTVYLYSWVYTSMLYPAFVVRSRRLFLRVAAAYALVVSVSLVCFWVFPVTSLGFRPDAATLDLTAFANWGIRLTFFADPPTNLFPSLHMSVAVIAALSAWKARRIYGALASTFVVAISVSILTTKQHYIADGLAGWLLAAVVYALVLRPYDETAEPMEERAFSGLGVLAYVAFHLSVYGAMYLAFRAGFAPWSAG